MLSAFQEIHTIEEWSAMHGVPPDTIRSRLRRRWSPEDAVTVPVEEKKSLRMQAMGHAGAIVRTARLSADRRKDIARKASAGLNGEPYRITVNGRTGTIHDWAHWSGIRPVTIYMRIFELGWDEERAVTDPVRRKR